jgi:20S proteasome subunit beta 4
MSTSLLIAGMIPSFNSADVHVDNMMGDSFERVKRQVINSMDALGSSRVEKRGEKNGNETHIEASTQMLLQPKLFWLDEYGSIQNIKYGAHGLGSNFVLSILDRGYSKDITKQQALELMNECFAQLKKRFLINSPESPCIKCIDTDGCHVL